LKGLSPFNNHSSPSPFNERGIKGVRLVRIIIRGISGYED